MKAMYYEAFGARPIVTQLPDPEPRPDGIVLRVAATGLCRSDWHGWMGHDPDIVLPHVPGHEFAGTVAAVGREVTRWRVGDRVTVPFICACGACPECHAGHHQVCDKQVQPGFTQWGSFAEYVPLPQADLNVVALPDSVDFDTAASLGCRFATSFRAVIDQGRVSAGEWVAVHGCGGVGLSAVMIAAAVGAQVIAIDIDSRKLDLASRLGAVAVVDAREGRVAEAVHDVTRGGAHVSIDALGHPVTCETSILSLRKRGRHVQVGLLLADQSRPPLPMDRVIGWELEIRGSHGMQAHRYDAMLSMISNGVLKPDLLVGQRISLEEGIDGLMAMDSFQSLGATVITRF